MQASYNFTVPIKQMDARSIVLNHKYGSMFHHGFHVPVSSLVFWDVEKPNRMDRLDFSRNYSLQSPLDSKLRVCKSGDAESLLAAKHLPEEFDPVDICAKVFGKKENVLGKNVRSSCLAVTEPEGNDEVRRKREAYMASVFAKYRHSLIEKMEHHLGYPNNLDFDYGALAHLQRFSINNIGDPFIEANYGVHTKQFEVGILDWFARLWELEKHEYWGYVTSCGTEANLHGILVGREVLPDGLLYASGETHYSILKAAWMYRMEFVKVDTFISGEIDCADLKRRLLQNKDKPAIVNVNIGTTVKGAVDDLNMVIQTLEETGLNQDRFYIHCDGVLFGLMIPFVKLVNT